MRYGCPMRYRLWLRRWIWACWWIGTALIVGSWIGWVSNRVGWIGFGAAGASTLLSVVVNRAWRVPAETVGERAEESNDRP
jgi:hypothetical protein